MNEVKSASIHIAIAAKGETDITPCLDALFQDNKGLDIAVTIHIAHDQDLDIIAALQPYSCFTQVDSVGDASLIKVESTRTPNSTSILKLWGAALANASTQYVAVIDSNCPPAKGWLSAVSENIKKVIPVFYGSVEPGWPLNDRHIIGYLIEYAQFKSPIECDSEFPGNNLVFKTELLGPKQELINEGFFKTFMLWKLKEEHNTSPVYCKNMPVFYYKKFKFLYYIKRRKEHGRCFGGCRLKQNHQPPRWACIIFTPFLFLLRTVRIYNWLKPQPLLLKAFLRFLPIIISSELAWSYGEFLGYSFGEKGACSHLD
jgi:hypothetical protein